MEIDKTLEGQENVEANEELETSEQTEQPQAKPDEATTESPEASEDETLIDIDGQKMTPQQIKEGIMRQEDYTRKTQELSQLRREYEESRNQLPQSLESEQYTPEQRQAREMIKGWINEELNKAIRPIQNTVSDQEVKNEIKEVQAKFKLTEDQVQRALQKADQIGANQLEPVVQSILYEEKLEEMRKDTEAKTKKNLIKRKAAISETPNAAGKVSTGKYDIKGKSYDDILDDIKSTDLKDMEE